MINTIQAIDDKAVKSLSNFFISQNSFWYKFFAQYLIYCLPIVLVVLWFWNQKSKKVALRALFSVILAWPIIGNIIGQLINRPRPFETDGVKELIFHRPTYSFPSDHAAALFAVAFSFWLSGYKKLALSFFIVAILVSFFRIATAIHYPTDILVGAAIGLAAAYIIYYFDKPLEIIYNFIIKIFKLVKLA